MAPPERRKTRSAVSEGAAQLMSPDPNIEERMRRRKTPKKSVPPPKTPSPPRRSPAPKTPTRSPTGPKATQTPKTPVATQDPIKTRKSTSGKGKQKARLSPSDRSDEEYVPDPDPEPRKKKRSPNTDLSYILPVDAPEHEDSDHCMSPEKGPVNRSRSASSKRSPRPKARQTKCDSVSESGSDVGSHDTNKENATPGPQDQIEDQDGDQGADQPEDDTHNTTDTASTDTDGRSGANQQEEQHSDVDSQISASDGFSAGTADTGNQTPIGGEFYLSGRKMPSDLLRKRALFQNLETPYPGYTTAELKSAMKRHLQEGDEDAASTSRPPKRAHFANGNDGDDDDDEYRPSSYLEDPLKGIFDRILLIPEDLNLAEIGACFTELQDLSQAFAKKFFSFQLNDEQVEAWPLHLLKWDYFGLKTMAQWLADSDAYSWRDFFTNPESRVALVHAIVGEYLEEHVFKQTAFSFTGPKLEKLKELDEKYLKYDAFVRNKKRAALLTKIIHETHGFWLAHRQDMLNASDSLARLILELVEPLMPPRLFDPLISSRCLLEPKSRHPFRGDKITEAEKQAAKNLWDYMMHDLRVLIYKAASVHLSIRLSGKDGTNVRILRPIAKGTAFTQSETMECINEADYDIEKPDPPSEHDEWQIKMTCWGQVEAVVPHNVDLEQYEQIEAQFNAQTGQDGPRSFDGLEEYFKQHLPVLHAEIQEDEDVDKLSDGHRHPGTEWDHDMAQDEAQQRRPQNGRGQTRCHGTPSQEDVNPFHLPDRGSFVTYYKCIARSQVYCEWATKGHMNHALQPLDAAVEEARLASGLYYKLEDGFINTTSAVLRLIERNGLHEYWYEALIFAITLAGLPPIFILGRSDYWAPVRLAMHRAADTVAHAMSSPENAREVLLNLRARVLGTLLALQPTTRMLRPTTRMLRPTVSQPYVLQATTL
ncbi:uncharacterized protein A1O9_00084 [Exophiala aquamarina CBS 119918]|uniref:Uncharacterized protein n=1 Tax=Exophiala aquamarina CBS 119918 TaxID=1182545 RepID=A0A072PQT3_9EURO|nr:uncharacterized protein A1O9_00084 [Exophiala aquamarina CBS 119918]KEF62112.1 hypothetical protein A1O9_00084 [Exophiala aquamarina CBS 119918]